MLGTTYNIVLWTEACPDNPYHTSLLSKKTRCNKKFRLRVEPIQDHPRKLVELLNIASDAYIFGLSFDKELYHLNLSGPDARPHDDVCLFVCLFVCMFLCIT